MLTTSARSGLKAPISTVPRRCGRAALVGGDAADGVVTRADGRAAGQQGHRLGRAAVIAQRRQHGVKRLGDRAGQVGADPAGAAVGLADQVVALGEKKVPKTSGPLRGACVPRHDRVADGRPSQPISGRGCRRRSQAELPLTVQLSRMLGLASPTMYRPPPLSPAELPAMVQSVRIVVVGGDAAHRR